MMAGKTMTASLAGFRISSVNKMRAILKQSVHDVVNIAQTPKGHGGDMPVLDGYLINSLVSTLNDTIGSSDGKPDKSGAGSNASVELTISEMELGDQAIFAYTAAHGPRQEFGFSGQDSLGRTYNQPGNHFVGNATDQWVKIVEGNAKKVSG